jgi:hypothetical protein
VRSAVQLHHSACVPGVLVAARHRSIVLRFVLSEIPATRTSWHHRQVEADTTSCAADQDPRLLFQLSGAQLHRKRTSALRLLPCRHARAMSRCTADDRPPNLATISAGLELAPQLEVVD